MGMRRYLHPLTQQPPEGNETMKTYKIAVIPGDGTGPEVTQEAIKVLKVASDKFGFKLDLQTDPLDLEEVERALHGSDPYMAEWARSMRATLDQGSQPDRMVPFEVQAVTFGTSLLLVTLAAEATVEHGLRFKREWGERFDQVLVLGYANGVVGYVPVRRQKPEGGYEVDWANRFHGRPGAFRAETEDQIHAAVRQALRGR